MLDGLTQFPVWLGIFVTVIVMCVAGLASYRLTRVLVESSERIPGRAVNNLFRVVGVLFSLMISLAFNSVVTEHNGVEQSVRLETAAIADTLDALDAYGHPTAEAAKETALEYTRLVVEDDWPALAVGELGDDAGAALSQLAEQAQTLEAADVIQEERRTRILTDIDAMSDARRARLNVALADPPVYFYVLFVGFLVTMALFGNYAPRRTLIVLLCVYSAFIGLLVYIMVATIVPFDGPLKVAPDQFTALLT